MAKRILPTPEQLRELLRYEPETGKLYWKPRPVEMFSAGNTSAEANCKAWNTRYAGKEAFTSISTHGYRQGSVFDRMYQAHRVIWAVHYGEWPNGEVDHIDTDRLNNRIANLREATHSENKRNQGIRKSNTSGYKGVSWNSGAKSFCAQIYLEGKRIFLGYHATAEAAHAAYCEAAKKYHGEFARTE